MKNSIWIICVITVVGHFIIQQRGQIQKLEFSSEMSDKARSIDADQIRDLIFINQKLIYEKDSIANRSYVSGVVSVIENKDQIEKIWHDGYERGTEVQVLAYQVKKEEDIKSNPLDLTTNK